MIVPMLRRFFAPLTIALTNRTAAMVLIRDLGWTLDETFELDALEKLDPVKTRLDTFLTEIENYDPDDPNVGGLVEQAILLAGDVQEAIQDLRQITDGQVSGLIAPLNTADFWEEFALDLPEYLILTYLRLYMPPLHALIYFGGAIVLEARDDGRPDRETLDWEALGRLFTDPDGQIRDFYDWGGTLRHQLLIKRLGVLLEALGLTTHRTALPEAIVADRYPDGGGSVVQGLSVPILEPIKQRMAWDDPNAGALTSSSLDLLLAPVPNSPNGTAPDGLLLTIEALGTASFSLPLGRGWLLSSTASIDLSGVLGAEFQPTGLALATGSPAGSIGLELSLTTPTDKPKILFGQPNKTRLELSSASASIEASANASSQDITAGVSLDGMQIVISAGDGDSFLSEILSEAQVVVPIEFGFEWSRANGVQLNGGAGFEIEFLIDKHLGPAHIQKLGIGGILTTEGAEFTATTAGSLKIGPFGTVVDGIGVRVNLVPNERGQGGRGGAVSAKVGFKPPTKIGLFLEAPGVGGGGYLAIDEPNGKYDGILDITLFGFKVTAIGMITTRLPSGERGWSVFLSISIIFPNGIPLVFGFSWTGVGGLIGINRGIDIDALGDGVRSGSLNAVLFPEDAIANAPMILAALDTFFPVQKGQYAFGPIFQISWGVNDLVTIQLGLAIQLPEPLTISLLGSLILRVGLPDEAASAADAAEGEEEALRDVIRIRVDVIGTLWPTEGKLAIDASITEGFIVGMNLSGDMAVRMEFGGRPNVIASLGGFHPQFTAPEGFPTLNRLSFRIFDETNLRLGVESYMAVTSNSFHFGVAAFFYASAIGFTAEGRFEFDTLIIFRPFGLVASLGFQVSVSAGSIDILQILLRGTLTGPKPWFVTGSAEFRFLGAKKSFNVEMTLGSAVQNGPGDVEALFDTVRDALSEVEAWAPEQTDTGILDAVQFGTNSDEVLFHPALRAIVQQGVAPLGIRLEKFGEASIADGEDLLTISEAKIGGQAATADSVEEWFAPANFFEMTEEEKITAPSFEELESGRSLGSAAPKFADASAFPMGHENIIVDPDVEAEWPQKEEDKEPDTDEKRNANITPAMDAQLPKFSAGLDLKPKAAANFTVTKPQLEARRPDQPNTPIRPTTFTQALAHKRFAAAKGEVRVIQATYERELLTA